MTQDDAAKSAPTLGSGLPGADRARLRRGIAAYAKHQEELLQVIAWRDGRMTQQEFDAAFAEYTYEHIGYTDSGAKKIQPQRNPRCFWMAHVDEQTFLLGDNTRQDRSKWLELLQIMVQIGDVQTEGEPPNLVYVVKR